MYVSAELGSKDLVDFTRELRPLFHSTPGFLPAFLRFYNFHPTQFHRLFVL
jgi:hypothetical protein